MSLRCPADPPFRRHQSIRHRTSRCSGAARALSLPFVDSSCQEVTAGVKLGGFVLNPSAALSVDEISLVPLDTFRNVIRTLAADAM